MTSASANIAFVSSNEIKVLDFARHYSGLGVSTLSGPTIVVVISFFGAVMANIPQHQEADRVMNELIRAVKDHPFLFESASTHSFIIYERVGREATAGGQIPAIAQKLGSVGGWRPRMIPYELEFLSSRETWRGQIGVLIDANSQPPKLVVDGVQMHIWKSQH